MWRKTTPFAHIGGSPQFHTVYSFKWKKPQEAMGLLTRTARWKRCVPRARLPIYEPFNSLCALRWLTVFIRLKPVVVDLSGQLFAALSRGVATPARLQNRA